MARLAHAVEYFDTTMKTLADTAGGPVADMSSKVTLFTASDFGRNFTKIGRAHV